MTTGFHDILASFTSPVYIDLTPASTLWLFPLIASIAIIYKITKLKKITAAGLIRECIILFGTISVVMVLIAFGLYFVAWLFT